MYRGKAECNILKKIRHQIATENGIDYEISQCDFQGDCKGTCPKCESELKYLEHQLIQKEKLGKSVLVAGLSAGIISTLLSCHDKPKTIPTIPIVATDTVQVDTVQNDNIDVKKTNLENYEIFRFGYIEYETINITTVGDIVPIDEPEEINIIEDVPSPFPGDSIYIENKESR